MNFNISLTPCVLKKMMNEYLYYNPNLYNEVTRHKINFNEKIGELYRECLGEICFQQWFASGLNFNFLKENTLPNQTGKYYINHQILKEEKILLDCFLNPMTNLDEKIIITDIFKNKLKQLEIISSNDLIDLSKNHILNTYRLPQASVELRKNSSCINFVQYLSKFFKETDEVILEEPYFYQNRDRFEKYFLSKIPKKSSIIIYTYPHNTNINLIKTYLMSAKYKDYNVELYSVLNYQDIHARRIITKNYEISLDKGLANFKMNNKMTRTIYSIAKRNKPYNIIEATKITMT